MYIVQIVVLVDQCKLMQNVDQLIYLGFLHVSKEIEGKSCEKTGLRPNYFFKRQSSLSSFLHKIIHNTGPDWYSAG